MNVTLRNHFLIAMPGMEDSIFAHSITYLCEHNEHGAMGIIVNRPLELSFDDIFDHLDIPDFRRHHDQPVLAGGPVQTERGFVLHVPAGQYSSSLAVAEDIALTTSKDVLEAVAGGTGPSKLLVTLGYSGWGAGQLESEVSANAWLTVDARPTIIFDTPAEARQSAALRLLGIDPAQLSAQAGHA